MSLKLASNSGQISWLLSPSFTAMVANPVTLKTAKNEVGKFVGDVIVDGTKDLPRKNILRILLRLLNPLVQHAIKKENGIIEKGMGVLEKCGFDPECIKSIIIRNKLTTSGSVIEKKIKEYIIQTPSVSYVRVIAETALSFELKGFKKTMNVDDTLAISLECGNKAPLSLKIEALTGINASFSLLFGDDVKCTEKDEVVQNPPNIARRSATDNLVGGYTRSAQTSSSMSSGAIAGIVIACLVVVAVVVALVLFVLFKKGIILQNEDSIGNSNADKTGNEERLLPEL